jgi:hypothetical protein
MYGKRSDDPLPRDLGNFRLIDRQVIEVLHADGDVHPCIRGRIAVMGFTQTRIPFDRSKRQAGETKFSFSSIVRQAVDGITSHAAALRHLFWHRHYGGIVCRCSDLPVRPAVLRCELASGLRGVGCRGAVEAVTPPEEPARQPPARNWQGRQRGRSGHKGAVPARQHFGRGL